MTDTIRVRSVYPFSAADRAWLDGIDPRVELVHGGDDDAAWSAALDDADVQVLWSNYPPPNLDRVPRLRWLAMASAGLDAVVALDPWALGLTVTNGSGLHAVPMGEYVLAAAMFASERIEARLAGHAAHSWPARDGSRAAERQAAARPDGGHHRLRQRRPRGRLACWQPAACASWPSRPTRRSASTTAGASPAPATRTAASRPASWARSRSATSWPRPTWWCSRCPSTRAHAGHHRRRPSWARCDPMPGWSTSVGVRSWTRTPWSGCSGAGASAARCWTSWSQEPLPADHPLWDLPNCLVTPHVSGTGDRDMLWHVTAGVHGREPAALPAGGAAAQPDIGGRRLLSRGRQRRRDRTGGGVGYRLEGGVLEASIVDGTCLGWRAGAGCLRCASRAARASSLALHLLLLLACGAVLACPLLRRAQEVPVPGGEAGAPGCPPPPRPG